MRVPDIYVKSLGVTLPEKVSVASAVEQGLFPAERAEANDFASVVIAGDTPAPELALSAAESALKRCGHDPREVDLLLYADTWHQGPDGWQPESHLTRHLLGGDTLAVEVRQGCTGMFAALQVATGMLRAPGGRETALVVAADNYGTPLLDRWSTGAGFVPGDAAVAVLLSTEEGFARLTALRSVAVPEAEGMHRGDEPMFPPGATTGRSLNFAERGDAFRVRALSSPEGTAPLLEIQAKMMALVGDCLDDAGITMNDVTRIAFNHFSREMVEQRAMLPLGRTLADSTWEFGRTVGHLGASDHIAALDDLLTSGGLAAGDHLLMLGIGPGVTLSAAVVRILEAPPWTT